MQRPARARRPPRNHAARSYYVYIMTNASRTLYTGVTNNLEVRSAQHRAGTPGSFTARYRIRYVVYYESFSDVRDAIAREKQIKGWLRAKKIALIDSVNPQWRDLSAEWRGEQGETGDGTHGSLPAKDALRPGETGVAGSAARDASLRSA